jgi:hypothetical protein
MEAAAATSAMEAAAAATSAMWRGPCLVRAGKGQQQADEQAGKALFRAHIVLPKNRVSFPLAMHAHCPPATCGRSFVYAH